MDGVETRPEFVLITFPYIDGRYQVNVRPYSPGSEAAIPDGPDREFSEKFERAAKEANKSYAIATDPSSRTTVETAVYNRGHGKGRKLFGSTSQSSLESNVGNAVEAAVRAVADPTEQEYDAYPGNSKSSPLKIHELARLVITGRFTKGNGSAKKPYSATKSMQRYRRAIENQPDTQTPTSIEGDVEGARFALGLAAAVSTIKRGFLNNPPGLSQKNYPLSMVAEDLRGYNQARKNQSTYWSGKNSELQARTRELMPNVYDKSFLQKTAALIRQGRSVLRQLAYMPAFGLHKNLDKPHKHALVQDILAVLHHNEANLRILFTETNKRKTYDIDTLKKFGLTIMNAIPEDMISPSRTIEIVAKSGGTLDEHSLDPHDRIALSRNDGLGGNGKIVSLIRRLRRKPLPAAAEAKDKIAA